MPEYKVTWSGIFTRIVDLPDGLETYQAIEYIKNNIGLFDLFHSAATVKIPYNEEYIPDDIVRQYTAKELEQMPLKRKERR